MVTKKSVKSLKVSRETLRHMTIEELRLVGAGISDSSCGGSTATSAHCCYTK
jgi:hypothetical protein